MWLFRFPLFFTTRNRVGQQLPRSLPSSSSCPALPVIATTSRPRLPSAPRAPGPAAPAACRSTSITRPHRRVRASPAVRAATSLDDRPRRAARQHLGDEIVAVEPRAPQAPRTGRPAAASGCRSRRRPTRVCRAAPDVRAAVACATQPSVRRSALTRPATSAAAPPAPPAPPPRRRTAACGRRSPGTSRAPCRR